MQHTFGDYETELFKPLSDFMSYLNKVDTSRQTVN